MPDDTARTTALDFVLGTTWAILPEALEQVIAVASRTNDEMRALLMQDGTPLRGGRHAVVRDGGVAVVPVTGPIARRANLFSQISGATSTDVLAADFRAAMDDPDIQAIVLDVDSPGGAVPGIAELAAHISGAGASAAYWLASAADQIVVEPTAQVGSIGVALRIASDLQRKGVREFISSQSPNKRLDLESDDGRAQVQALVDDVANVFLSDVARHRGVDVEAVMERYGAGGLMVGEKAVSAGMVDAVGSLESVIAGMSGGRGGVAMATSQTKAPEITRDMVAGDHPAVYEQIKAEGAGEAKAAYDEALRAEREALGALRAELEQAKVDAAAAERARIQGVLDQSLPGHEALVQSLAFDGVTAPEAAAVQVLKAAREDGEKYLERRREEGATKVKPSASPTGDVAASVNPDDDESVRAAYNASAEVQGEFASWEAYGAYLRATRDGRVKRLTARG